MKIIKTKKQLDKAFDNMEKGRTDLLIKVNPKNIRDNCIHKEGFDAGYKKGYKEGYKEGTLETIRYSLLNSFGVIQERGRHETKRY